MDYPIPILLGREALMFPNRRISRILYRDMASNAYFNPADESIHVGKPLVEGLLKRYTPQQAGQCVSFVIRHELWHSVATWGWPKDLPTRLDYTVLNLLEDIRVNKGVHNLDDSIFEGIQNTYAHLSALDSREESVFNKLPIMEFLTFIGDLGGASFSGYFPEIVEKRAKEFESFPAWEATLPHILQIQSLQPDIFSTRECLDFSDQFVGEGKAILDLLRPHINQAQALINAAQVACSDGEVSEEGQGPGQGGQGQGGQGQGGQGRGEGQGQGEGQEADQEAQGKGKPKTSGNGVGEEAPGIRIWGMLPPEVIENLVGEPTQADQAGPNAIAPGVAKGDNVGTVSDPTTKSRGADYVDLNPEQYNQANGAQVKQLLIPVSSQTAVAAIRDLTPIVNYVTGLLATGKIKGPGSDPRFSQQALSPQGSKLNVRRYIRSRLNPGEKEYYHQNRPGVTLGSGGNKNHLKYLFMGGLSTCSICCDVPKSRYITAVVYLAAQALGVRPTYMVSKEGESIPILNGLPTETPPTHLAKLLNGVGPDPDASQAMDGPLLLDIMKRAGAARAKDPRVGVLLFDDECTYDPGCTALSEVAKDFRVPTIRLSFNKGGGMDYRRGDVLNQMGIPTLLVDSSGSNPTATLHLTLKYVADFLKNPQQFIAQQGKKMVVMNKQPLIGVPGEMPAGYPGKLSGVKEARGVVVNSLNDQTGQKHAHGAACPCCGHLEEVDIDI